MNIPADYSLSICRAANIRHLQLEAKTATLIGNIRWNSQRHRIALRVVSRCIVVRKLVVMNCPICPLTLCGTPGHPLQQLQRRLRLR